MCSRLFQFCLWLISLITLTSSALPAQTGVIAFRDDCTGLLYAMHGDGSGRIQLPLPPLPPATNVYTYRYWQPTVLDVTRRGPLTVIYYLGIAAITSQHVLAFYDQGLFAVQLNDVGGMLVPDAPVRFSLPTLIEGVDPNSARFGSIAATADRLALVADSSTSSVVMTAQIERDATSKITGISAPVVVGNLYSIGLPNPDFPDSRGFTGSIAYASDGTGIVASIYFDLWTISLASDNTFLSVARLTENTDRSAAWNPSFSPDGSRIAYTRGPISGSGTTVGVNPRGMNIFSLTLTPRSVVQVTNNQNNGSATSNRNNAMWTQDGASIGFSAFTSSTPRNSSCSLVNSDIFLIKADGSATAVDITNTNGTSVEAWPRGGWQ